MEMYVEIFVKIFFAKSKEVEGGRPEAKSRKQILAIFVQIFVEIFVRYI